MSNERFEDRPEGQEESEYHFSDDQVNYEMESESYKDGSVVAAPRKSNFVEKLKQNRRIVMGGVVFLVLLVLVYRMLVPSTTVPSTEIAQQALPATPVKAASKPAIPVETASQQKTAPVAAPPPPAPAPAAPAQPEVAAAQPIPPSGPPAGVVIPQQVQQMSTPPASQPVPPAPAQQPVVVLNAPPVEGNKPIPPPPLQENAQEQQQGSAVVNLIQTQYSQKMAEQDAQVNEMKTQMQELNTRVASMEVAFRQLTKILRTAHSMPPPATITSPIGAAIAQKLNYTVQAIIPGRAWLKSDSGDTVTVAEGDILKDIGRITKIDPYDGIVNIDTGRKIITLSYGATSD